MNKLITGLLLIAVLFIAACTTQPAANNNQNTENKGNAQNTKPTNEGSAEIIVGNQEIFADVIDISKVVFDKSGFVVIHTVENGKPGAIVGNSEVFTPGTHTNVGVKLPRESWEYHKQLIAMIHYDDGDNTYEYPSSDLPALKEGQVVMVLFSVLNAKDESESEAENDGKLGTAVAGTGITPSVQTEDVKEITMQVSDWEFNPSTIRVKKGQTVKLHISTAEGNHGIAIPDFGISAQLPVGTEKTIEFVADKKGTYSFFCNVFCGSGHKDMKGTLIVE